MSRIEQLIARIEAGEQITQADVDLTAQLIELDVAVAGEHFVSQSLAAQREADELLID